LGLHDTHASKQTNHQGKNNLFHIRANNLIHLNSSCKDKNY
jgi:hypothetical protein